MPTERAPGYANGRTQALPGVEVTPSGAALIALAAMVFWLFNHAYQGIYHDAILYALSAARWIDPAAYARELFFQFGSQDEFSLFSPLYGTLISWVGLDAAAQTIVLGGGALWVLACLALARSMFRPIWLVALAVLFCAAMKFSYAPNFGTFTFNENFATARSLAIPLAVLALAAALTGRKVFALFLAIAAIALHPLLGIWVPLLSVVRAFPEKLLCGGIAIFFIALFGGSVVLPFEALRVMDAEWAETVRAATPSDVFLGGWGVLRLADILLTVGILWLAGRVGSERHRELFLRLCLLTVVAILGAQLCSYFWPIRIVMQVQPWRILWLAEFMAIFAVVDLLGAASVAGRRYLVASLGVAAAAWGLPEVRHLMPFLALLLLSTERSTRLLAGAVEELSRRAVLAWFLGVGLVVTLLPSYWMSLELLGFTVLANWLPDFPAAKGFLVTGGEGIFFVILALSMHYKSGRWIILVAALPSLVVGAGLWDVRGSAFRQMEGDYLSVHPATWIDGLPVRPGDVVAWPERQFETWLVLNTSVYATTWQAIAIVFSRPRMVEVKRRLERASISTLPDQMDMFDRDAAISEVRRNLVAAGHDIRNLHRYGQGFATSAGVAYLCQDKVLDWVISRQAKASSVSGLRFDPGAAYGGIQYLFDCRNFREPGQVNG